MPARITSYVSSIACLLIIIGYFALIRMNAVNLPIGDDFYCGLLFTQRFQDAPKLTEKFALLIESWVEHRIVYSKLVALFSWLLTGEVNFLLMIWVGNLSLVVIFLFFARIFRSMGLSACYLLPVALTLFNPVMYEGNLWAGASTVYMPIVMMALVSIYLLAKETMMAFVGALLIACLAAFSYGNGMFVFISGIVVLVIQAKMRFLAIWVPVAVAIIFAYFHNAELHSGTNAFGFASHVDAPVYLLFNFLAFAGGVFDCSENVGSPVALSNVLGLSMGAVLAGIVMFVLIRLMPSLFRKERPDNRNVSMWLAVTVFLLLTALAIGYSRTSGEGMNTISSRYKIYSMLFLLSSYWACLVWLGRRTVTGWVFSLLCAGSCVFGFYMNYEKIASHGSAYLAGTYNYLRNGSWHIYRGTYYFEKASQAVSDTIRAKENPVFSFRRMFPALDTANLERGSMLGDVRVELHLDARDRNFLLVESIGYPVNNNFPDPIYLIVYHGPERFLLPAVPLRSGRMNMLLQGRYFKPGFYCDGLLEGMVRPGVSYKLAVFCPGEKEPIRPIDFCFAI